MSYPFIAFFIALFTLASILIIGGAILAACRTQKKGIELLAYSAVAGIVFHAVVGIVIAFGIFPQRLIGFCGLVLGNIAAIVYLFRSNSGFVSSVTSDELSLVGIFGVISAAIFSLLIAFLPAKMPENLVDGPYVIKNTNQHVKVQYILGSLPADNVIPHIVSEFFLRQIPFKIERPILPGQEVSNRPILMSLVVIPFRDLIDPPPRQLDRLDRFSYVGSSWPNVAPLATDRVFIQFLPVAVILNSFMMLGVALLMKRFDIPKTYASLAMLALVSSPYYLSQILFTWPKALGAFFLLLALAELLSESRPVLVGVLTGLAYWSHPYAVVFAFSFCAYFLFYDQRQSIDSRIKLSAQCFLPWFLVVLPWFIWTKVYLDIPSDLIAQNASHRGHLLKFFWVRIFNTYQLLTPVMFEVYPLKVKDIFSSFIVCLPGLIGLLFFLPAYIGTLAKHSDRTTTSFFYVLLPGLLLVSVFSAPAVPALHGFQAIAPVMFLSGVRWLVGYGTSSSLILRMFYAQIFVNAGVWAIQIFTVVK